jgi:hypothetical protein
MTYSIVIDEPDKRAIFRNFFLLNFGYDYLGRRGCFLGKGGGEEKNCNDDKRR